VLDSAGFIQSLPPVFHRVVDTSRGIGSTRRGTRTSVPRCPRLASTRRCFGRRHRGTRLGIVDLAGWPSNTRWWPPVRERVVASDRDGGGVGPIIRREGWPGASVAAGLPATRRDLERVLPGRDLQVAGARRRLSSSTRCQSSAVAILSPCRDQTGTVPRARIKNWLKRQQRSRECTQWLCLRISS
jgi:hypothetical protein